MCCIVLMLRRDWKKYNNFISGNNSRVAERGIVFRVMLSSCYLLAFFGHFVQKSRRPIPLTPFPCYFIKGRGIDKRGGLCPLSKYIKGGGRV